jgi:PhzF family phenazine biosynthesis protein
MKKVTVHIVQSFVKNGAGGNAAGVVTHADGLSSEQMQTIATKVGYSETAFVLPSDNADFKLCFFTPNGEVDLCGHATVATFSLLNALEIIKTGEYKQETKAGLLGVKIHENGIVFYEQTPPIFSEYIPVRKIADALRIPDEWIEASGFEPQVVSTGMRDILVGINLRSRLEGWIPDFEKIKVLSKEHTTIGIHAFTMDTIDPATATAHGRNFAPLYDIDEEAATGSSNGALACYLFHHKKIPAWKSDNLIFEQGYSMKSPSEICVSLCVQNNGITDVWAGGRAVKTSEMVVDIPQ